MTTPPQPTERDRQDGGLYRHVLGADWRRLHPAVRRAHADPAETPVRGGGWFRVVHGRSALARIVLWLVPLPEAAERQWVELAVLPHPRGERWVRDFGRRRRLASVQRQGSPGRLLEAMGPLLYRYRLRAAGGGLRYLLDGCALRLGCLALPLPCRLWPRIDAWVQPVSRRCWTAAVVSVRISLPLAGLLVHYEGVLHLAEPKP
jgi:hypothetical protein